MLVQAAALVLTYGVSGVLLWAGLEKLRAFAAFDTTLAALGLPRGLRRAVGLGVPFAEIITALGVVLLPGQTWPRLAVAGLAAGFAAAGLRGLRADRPVTCSCFGATGNAVLGWRQLYAFPIWLAAVVALDRMGSAWPPRQAVAHLAVVVGVLCGLRAAVLVSAWRRAADNRRAVGEVLYPRRARMFVAPDGGR
ncbi:MAG: hypothetical protein GEV03_08265 [Streptosporangiales bacterium]|nr:hypothetical protein [Streptosporangiales bacterium]